MTPHKLNYKKKLEEEKVALIKQLQEIGRINPDDTSDWEPVAVAHDNNQPEIEERATEITSFEDRSAVEYELEAQLKGVDIALEAIANNSYGQCVVCNAPIEDARLEANPSAVTCVAHMD